jgi:hypothetical protein
MEERIYIRMFKIKTRVEDCGLHNYDGKVPSSHNAFCLSGDKISQVSEDVVLHDTTGLHLGAGPYILMYSRAYLADEIGAPSPWAPSSVVCNKCLTCSLSLTGLNRLQEDVLRNNDLFLTDLGEVASERHRLKSSTTVTKTLAEDRAMDVGV